MQKLVAASMLLNPVTYVPGSAESSALSIGSVKPDLSSLHYHLTFQCERSKVFWSDHLPHQY